MIHVINNNRTNLAARITSLTIAFATIVMCFPQSASAQPQTGLAASLVGKEFQGEAELVIDTGGFMGDVFSLAFSPDGTQLAAAGGKIVRVWDTRTGQLLATLRGDYNRTSYGNCHTVAYSPSGKELLVGINDYRPHGSIRVYSTSNLNELQQLLPGHEAPCRNIAFSRDGRHMVSADADGHLFIWDWSRRQILKRIAPPDPTKPILDYLAFPQADPVLVSVGLTGPRIYSVPTGQQLTPRDEIPELLRGWLVDILSQQVQYPFGVKFTPNVFDLQFDRQRWATAGTAKTSRGQVYWIGIWRARAQGAANKPQQLAVYSKHRWNVSAIALAPVGNLAASADRFGEVHIWDSRTGALQHRLQSRGEPIYEVNFDSGSNRIAFGTQAHTPPTWGRNQYGAARRVFDLQRRNIASIKAHAGLVAQNETTKQGATSVRIGQRGDRLVLVKEKNGQAQSEYRVRSGGNPTVFSLLGGSALGVQDPVLFGDQEGLLAAWDSSTDELRRAFIGHGSFVTAVSTSPDHRLLASGSTDRTIRLWSLQDYRPTGIFDFKFENSSVTKVIPGTSSQRAGVQVGDRIISLDGKSLTDISLLMLTGKFPYRPGQAIPVVLSRQGKQFTYKMTLETGYDFAEPLLNVFMTADGKWIMWTPTGYYDASPGADRLIGWHVNRGPTKSAKFFEAQQFRKQLYRPDVINAILETGNVDKAVALANERRQRGETPLNFRDPNQLAQAHPPVATIESPTANQAVDEDPRVDFRATVKSINGLPITEVTLLHNGLPARVFKPREQNAQTMSVRHRMRLFPGRNTISVVATNARASSHPNKATVRLDGPLEATRPNVYVLAYGVSQYQNAGSGFENLNFAADDAKAFVQAVKLHQGGKLYGNIEAKIITDDQATRGNVLDGLQWLVSNVKAGDVAMIFAAGHGFTDDKDNFYLATHDTDKERLRSTAISWREVVDTLHEDLPACRRIVFLDACRSGGVARSGVRSPLHDLSTPEIGTIFFASCGFQEDSFERKEWRHGAFTKSLLETLGDHKSDTMPRAGDLLLNTLELEQSVTQRVHVLTQDRQHPIVFSPDTVRRFNLLELKSAPK